MTELLQRYASKSRPGTSHEVRRGADGRIYCTCPRWLYQHGPRGQRRDCRHVVLVRRQLERAARARQKWEQVELFAQVRGNTSR